MTAAWERQSANAVPRVRTIMWVSVESFKFYWWVAFCMMGGKMA